MNNTFKFNIGDIAYLIAMSFANGKKGMYRSVTINERWTDEKWGNEYSLIENDGNKIDKCNELCLLNKEELEIELKKGSVLAKEW